VTGGGSVSEGRVGAGIETDTDTEMDTETEIDGDEGSPVGGAPVGVTGAEAGGGTDDPGVPGVGNDSEGRGGTGLDGLVEEVDVGGPTLDGFGGTVVNTIGVGSTGCCPLAETGGHSATARATRHGMTRMYQIRASG
jgi:hypothetical protein